MKYSNKRIVSVLICLAMVLAMVPMAVYATGDVQPVSSEIVVIEEGTVSLMSNPDPMLGIPAQTHEILWTAPSDGKLTIEMFASTPGWQYVYTDGDGVSYLPVRGTDDAANTYDVFSGKDYSFVLSCYDKAAWGEGNGDVSYRISFEAGEIESDPVIEESLYSDIVLSVGENELTMMENAENTLFDFTPSETGVYRFTVPVGYQIGNWGIFGMKPAEEMTFTFTWECTSVGQGIYVGVAGSESVVMTIEKSGEANIPEQIIYEDYVNVHTPSTANRPVLGYGMHYQNVDITVPQTVVMGDDGFYHLGSASGPVIYVDLINDAIDLTAAYAGYGANAMKGQLRDEDGNLVAAYNFLNSMKAYKDAMDKSGRYPLTEDLLLFLKAYGGVQGWYDANMTSFEAIKGEHCAESAWLVCCLYMADDEIVEPPVTEPSVTEPPVTEPPVTEPSVTEPPVTEPSVTEPSVTEPPVTEPSVTEPPVTEPSVTEPSVTEPSVTEPPVTEPSVTEPSVTEPPVTEPSVTEPSVTEPPVTEPPVTEPSVTEPPVTEPSVTEPPVTEPSVTEPPVTEPPVTEPPVTEPDAYSDYRVVGDAEWLGAWNPSNDAGRMTEIADGVYQITFKNVPVGSYEFKITKGGTWEENWGEGGSNGGNIKLTVETAGDVVITFTADGSDISVETPDEEIPKTGDATIAALAAALILAGTSVVVLKKKEN